MINPAYRRRSGQRYGNIVHFSCRCCRIQHYDGCEDVRWGYEEEGVDFAVVKGCDEVGMKEVTAQALALVTMMSLGMVSWLDDELIEAREGEKGRTRGARLYSRGWLF